MGKRKMNFAKVISAGLVSVLLLSTTTTATAQTPIATGVAGGGQPHNNMQPFVTLWWGIATGFSSDVTMSNRRLGEIRAFTRSPTDLNDDPIVGEVVPAGWTLADGRLLDIATNQELFSVLGTTYGGDGVTNFALPDLRGRTPRGTGSGPGLSPVTLGEVSGVENVRLTVSQMPAHTHNTDAGLTPSSGNSDPHTNLMPTLGLHCTIAVLGTFPPLSKPSGPVESQSTVVIEEPFLAEIRWFAGTNPEQTGWLPCDGRTLQIADNTALFSLLGTIYGGDGRTTLALPDLRGRVMVHKGNGPGIPDVQLGEKLGSEQTSLINSQIASHSHTILEGANDANTSPTGGGVSHNNMQPYLGLNYLISLIGAFPGNNAQDTNLISEVSIFAANFAPRGFAFLDGFPLAISSNSALFSLILNRFGGSFPTTFAIPEARGRVILGGGSGPGLSSRDLADSGGATTHTLTIGELPRHQHGVPSSFCIVIPVGDGKFATPCF